MSTDLNLEIISTDSDSTVLLGRLIGASLKGGEIFQLISDLGGGKTTFTKGVAMGAGSKDSVSSPTFTISKQYLTPKFVIKHFDFYRLNEPGLVRNELEEAIDDESDVVIIEWADIVRNILPKKTISIEFENNNENSRRILIKYHKKYDYLFKEVKHVFGN